MVHPPPSRRFSAPGATNERMTNPLITLGIVAPRLALVRPRMSRRVRRTALETLRFAAPSQRLDIGRPRYQSFPASSPARYRPAIERLGKTPSSRGRPSRIVAWSAGERAGANHSLPPLVRLPGRRIIEDRTFRPNRTIRSVVGVRSPRWHSGFRRTGGSQPLPPRTTTRPKKTKPSGGPGRRRRIRFSG